MPSHSTTIWRPGVSQAQEMASHFCLVQIQALDSSGMHIRDWE
jgi:hypothetical protein